MCPFHSWLVTLSLSTKVTESHRSVTLTCGVDVLLRDLWEDQAQQSSVIHEPMMQNRVRKNKRWSIEWFTLQNFSMLPPKSRLSECNSAKKQTNTQLCPIFQCFHICHKHIISKGVNPLGWRISSVYSTKNAAGPRLLSSSRWCHPKQLSKQSPFPGAESWQSSWDHGKMEFNLWRTKT